MQGRGRPVGAADSHPLVQGCQRCPSPSPGRTQRPQESAEPSTKPALVCFSGACPAFRPPGSSSLHGSVSSQLDRTCVETCSLLPCRALGCFWSLHPEALQRRLCLCHPVRGWLRGAGTEMGVSTSPSNYGCCDPPRPFMRPMEEPAAVNKLQTLVPPELTSHPYYPCHCKHPTR